jgi:hypothetical protein
VSSTTGTVSYSIRTPSWLTGTTVTRGVTITLTVTPTRHVFRQARMDLASRSRTCRTVRAARPGRQSWLSKRLHLSVVEASCWTTSEDTCWTTAVAICWRSNRRTQTIVPYRYVCIQDNIRLYVGGGRHDAITPGGLRRLSFSFVAPGRISLRVLLSESVSAHLLGLTGAAGRNTRSFSSIHPAAVLVPMRAASWPS